MREVGRRELDVEVGGWLERKGTDGDSTTQYRDVPSHHSNVISIVSCHHSIMTSSIMTSSIMASPRWCRDDSSIS